MRHPGPTLLVALVVSLLAAGPARAACPAFYNPYVHELNVRITIRVVVLLSGAMELAQETWRRYLDPTPPPRPVFAPLEPPRVVALPVRPVPDVLVP